jgi:hypothetical protein
MDVLGSQDYVNPYLLQVEAENASEGSSASLRERKYRLYREEGYIKRTCLASK